VTTDHRRNHPGYGRISLIQAQFGQRPFIGFSFRKQQRDEFDL